MSLNLLDFTSFITDGQLFTICFIAMVLFGIQATIAFLIWRKGSKNYFLRFVSFVISVVVLLFAVIALGQYFGESFGSEDLVWAGIYLCAIGAPIAAGIQIYLFISENWLSKEEKA